MPGYAVKNNDRVLIDAYEQFLSTRITLLPIQESVLRLAAQLRARNKLKTPDSIHAATALSHSPTLFLTNDVGFHNISNLSVVVLKDVLNA
jgi:predicted nucleic acid-binding protein